MHSSLLLFLTYILVGYRWITVSRFLSGLFTGFLTTNLLLHYLTELNLPILLCLSASVGIAAGFITFQIHLLALVLLSSQAGGLLACSCLLLPQYFYGYVSAAVMFITLISWSLCQTLISAVPLFHKPMYILNTSIIGASLILVFFDTYFHNSQILNHIYSFLSLTIVQSDYAFCKYSVALFSMWFLVSLSALVLQSLFTARKIHHSAGELLSGSKLTSNSPAE